MFLKKLWYRLIRKNPASMSMVKYWKTSESAQAKITKAKDGSIVMMIEGEDQPFPTFPRGHILYGRISKLKHEIKNQIFNDSWYLLEQGAAKEVVIKRIKFKLFDEIADIAQSMKYDMLPPRSMTPSVKELYRAFTVVGKDHPKREKIYCFRDYLCFILQEDDAYRFRVQWLVKFFGWMFKWKPERYFKKALELLEHAEVVGDMKERIRLLRRILLLVFEDPEISDLLKKFIKEVNWRKVKLTKADKYHFRGKYFKVDYPEIEY